MARVVQACAIFVSMKSHLQQYIEDAELLDSSQFYDYILQLGREAPSLENWERTRQSKVVGCQSQVWIKSIPTEGRCRFKIDSDSLMVKGVAFIVSEAFKDTYVDEVQEIKFEDFKPLAAKLTYQRQRGLQSMINKIHSMVI